MGAKAKIDAEDPLERVVARVLRAVRSFGKIDGNYVDEDVEFLRQYLCGQKVDSVLSSTTKLQAVSLIFDYEDQRGKPSSPVILPLFEEIFQYRNSKIPKIFQHEFVDEVARMKWMRQVIWVMMAHALWCHRGNDLDKMGRILSGAKELLDKNWLPGERPGTLSRWNYYRGLQLRDQGDLEKAMGHFLDSFRCAQERRTAKCSHSGRDSKRSDLKVEEAFSRSCLARIQAFGFGEVAFFRGDIAASSAWFRTASITLEGSGLERWKLSVNVYLNGSRILNSAPTAEGAKSIETAQQNLDSLARQLVKPHGGYSDLARAFSNLGLIRLEQIRLIERTPNSDALQVDLTEQLRTQLSDIPCHSGSPAGESKSATTSRRHGAISALISLISCEVLLRCKRTNECREELRWIRYSYASNVFAQVEADLLEAQLHMVERNWKQADGVLQKDRNLDYRANRNQRAFWLALASTVQIELKKSLSARVLALRAKSVANRVGNGFVKHFVQVAVGRVLSESTTILPMPYQEPIPNLSLDDNSEAWARNLIMTALELNPGIKSWEELAPVLGVGKTTLFDNRGLKNLREQFFKRRALSRPALVMEERGKEYDLVRRDPPA